jgi:MoaA/NifB/PqqE/SkfB family radical SAM enzyme
MNTYQNPLLSLKNIQSFVQGMIPGQLVIQIHSHCNAHCPQCGMRVTSGADRSKLAVDDIKRMIDSAAEKGVTAVSFTGGEPLLFFDELLALIEHAQKAGIRYIRTGTNGFLFRNSQREGFAAKITRMVESLAQTSLYTFWISIDSAVPEVHEQMRGLNGVIAGIEKALPIFHQHGIYPAVNLGINRNINGAASAQPMNGDSQQFYAMFREAFRTYYQFVLDLGFTMVNACYPMSIDTTDPGNLAAVYTATSEDMIVKFTPVEKALLFKALLDTIPEFRSKIRIFTPRTSLYTLFRHYSGEEMSGYACRGGIDFFFVDSADGYTYPCGYRGSERMGYFWDLDVRQIPREPFCRECDWECFRDPSELIGPLLDMLSKPSAVFEKFKADKYYASLLLKDWKYFYDCAFYNGRVPPDYRKLEAWAS